MDFNVSGEGDLTADIIYEAINTPSGYDNLYFSVYINGVFQNKRLCLNGSSNGKAETVMLASDLPNGCYNIQLVRQTEAYFGKVTIAGIGFKGSFENRSKDKTLIEFVGDSITVGMGNLGRNGEHTQPITQYPVYQDGTQAYAYMTAKNLDVDYRIVARTGIGVGYGYSDSETANFLSCYSYQNAFVGEKEEYHSERSADIICINLGTNDKWSGRCPSDDALAEKYIEFITMLNKYNPHVKSIVFVVGGINNSYINAVQKAVTQLGGESTGVYLCQTSYNLTSGEQGHPSVSQHIKMSQELTDFFIEKNILK